jgi:NADP-dependent 3-hydroxy acid dehydrogenase YdfG
VGAKVNFVDIDEARLAEVAQELTDSGGTVTAVQLDVSDTDQWPAAADRAEEALRPSRSSLTTRGWPGRAG